MTTRNAAPASAGNGSGAVDASPLSEVAGAVAAAGLGVLPRLAFVLTYPTRPISDFRTLVSMAVEMRHRGLAAPMWHWRFVNAGLPTFLSLILAVMPGDPADVARIATALLTGLVPLVPFFLLRGVLSFRLRVVGALLLALWPGQIVFSGVVAQDNWVILPVIAGVALAVRSLRLRRGYPVAAALIYASAVFIRQEMLLVLLPAAVVAAGSGDRSHRRSRMLTFAGIAVALLGVTAFQRGQATGRYRLTTEHGAQSLAGSYVPGARLDWVDPKPFLATFHEPAISVVAHEVETHPVFHAVRRTAASLDNAFHVDSGDMWWSLLDPEVQAGRDRARRFAVRAAPLLDDWIFMVHVAFVATLILGLFAQSREILVMAAVIFLKVAIHFLIVSGARFFVPVVAVELLAIPFGIALSGRKPVRAIAATVAGLLVVAALGLASKSAAAWSLDHEEIAQRTYRFVLHAPPPSRGLACVVDAGWVSSLSDGELRLEMLRRRPEAGAVARCRCEIAGESPARATALAIQDGFAPGGLPGRIVQRVMVDDRVVLVHDLAAEPGTGWQQVPLSDAERPARRVTVEIEALQPRGRIAWGDVAGTNIRVVAAGGLEAPAR